MLEKNEIQVFQFENVGEVRAMTADDGEVLFNAKDIATRAGYKNTNKAILDHCKRAETYPHVSLGQVRHSKWIPESDVYRLLAHSRLPEAARFEKWIFEDVLPAIRKTGRYDASPANPDPIVAMAELIVKVRQVQIAQEERIEATEVKVAEHDAQIAEALARIKTIPRAATRSRAEKVKAVDYILSLPGSERWPNRKIAEACHVSHPFVGKRRILSIRPPELSA